MDGPQGVKGHHPKEFKWLKERHFRWLVED